MDDSEYSGPAARQDLEGYHWDPGFDRNSERDSGKCKNSWLAMEIDCDSGRGIRRQSCTGKKTIFGVEITKAREKGAGMRAHRTPFLTLAHENTI